MTEADVVKFWLESAEKEVKVADDMLRLGHRDWALFFHQLVLEKALKALVVKNINESPLPVHDLKRLAKQAGITLTEEQEIDFKEISSFNIEARYDSIKYSFYKKTTKEFTQIWVEKCGRYFIWLKALILK